jgi:hypothetical protein
MTEALLIPLKVFGLGFVISMCMAVLIKFLMDAIKHFTNSEKEIQD